MSDASILAFVNSIFGGALAFIVAWNASRNIIQWSFVAGMAIFSIENIFNAFSFTAVSPDDLLHWQTLRMGVLSLLPGTWLLFSLTFGRGNYLEFLKRWHFVIAAAFLVPIGMVIGFGPHLLGDAGKTDSGKIVVQLKPPGAVLELIVLVSTVLVLMNLERTFRAAIGTMRWRIKFIVLGLSLIFAVRCYVCSQALLFHALDLSLQVVDACAFFGGCALACRSLSRKGHFDMDIYPGHGVLNNSVTVLLAGIYLLIVGVFAKIVSFLGGDASFTLKAFFVLVIVLAIAVLSLSDRVRLRTRRFLSRYFERPEHDYASVWKQFTEKSASCVRQKDLCQAMLKLVSDVFQVLSVSIWLVDEKKEQFVFAASTFLSENNADTLMPGKAESAEILRALRERHEPVDIDLARDAWAVALRLCHPDEFRKGGDRICVPMVAGGEILGFAILGDRIGGMPFSWQDFDLLKCIADQAAAGLLNIQLSQKLLQAKELEAFQTMSAFFVHDLKNTASTLNLMLKNLPVHFDDPAFRQDALRGVSKTVSHINYLIERLSLLRHELQIKPVETDLNDVVTRALSGWEDGAGIQLDKEFETLPKVLLDPEQMHKVITNLVLNAREAVAKQGTVHIRTTRQNGWAVLTVEDNGCGISPEFLNRMLFRPFQTTKKNGLGIGMFQSKMIVEAHNGKIEVESELNKGTKFRIFLPIQSQNS